MITTAEIAKAISNKVNRQVSIIGFIEENIKDAASKGKYIVTIQVESKSVSLITDILSNLGYRVDHIDGALLIRWG